MMSALDAAGKTVFEVPGVMSNPTVQKLDEGRKVTRDNDVDLILAVGGGSVIDYSKAVSVSAWYDGDAWEKFFLRMEEPDGKIIPVGDILTMSGTGSEMNAGSVITNHEEGLKIDHVFGSDVMPRFAIVNPELTFTVPDYQMRAGIYDAFNHICEQYFSGTDDNTSDYIAEGLMRSLVHASRIAVKDEIGVVKHLSELGFTEDMIDDAVKGTFILTGGYHPLTPDEVAQILRESM
ncbi:iron-containing alcohol dehydrogenase [Parafannyhessea umbonata]|uniref:iron-containing alcohol dehydrogenase n=1 Tax=Parafannyhessea umbonata TaxID=604330 RepID=UPI003F9EB6BE